MDISIHAPRVGSDTLRTSERSRISYFNPRSPCGERHRVQQKTFQSRSISIHAPRVGSDQRERPGSVGPDISIHAPRVGSDRDQCRHGDGGSKHFNPRSPCGERLLFQPAESDISHHFNPRSPCGERPVSLVQRLADFVSISIHAPRVGSDG